MREAEARPRVSSAGLDVDTGIRQYGLVKTTIDLPDTLYRRARIRAAERGTTLRAMLIEALEESLEKRDASPLELPRRDRFSVDERGWPVLKRKPSDDQVITEELINRLRDQEGV